MPYQLTVRLQSAEQLFEVVALNPTSPHYTEFTAQPAMETVRDLLLLRQPRKTDEVELLLLLPASHIRPGIDDDLTAAVRRWVRVQNRMDNESTAAGGAIGRRLFAVGVAVFLVLQTAAIYLRNYSDTTNNDPLAAVAEGLSVTSWVMLWFPVQTFTVEVWRNSIRRRRADVIERMTVRTAADPA